MKILKLTAVTSTQQVFMSETRWLKLWWQKEVTQDFHKCLINLYKDNTGIITSDNGKKYAVMLQEVKEK